MQETSTINVETRNGHYHLTVGGVFNPLTAEKICTALKSEYTGSGNIFINTGAITSVVDDSCRVLSKLLGRTDLPANRIYFKGKYAYTIYHDYGKVIHWSTKPKKLRCSGSCKKCRCSIDN